MITMYDFRMATAQNNLLDMEKLSNDLGPDFNINEPGPKSGKTAAHVAAERAHFKAIYWLLKKGADFFCNDNNNKTAIDYLQRNEFASMNSNPLTVEDREYYLCNAHCKIWLAHDKELFMPYLYQEDFRQYRKNNPEGYLSLVYSEMLLSETALAELKEFAKNYNINLISFENDLADLTKNFGTPKDKTCFSLAFEELKHYPEQQGGNLAVVADLIRWSSVLLRKGHYADTDVEIGQHKWTQSISVEKPMALNLGSLIYPNDMIVPWINGDIIAVSSLFPEVHPKGNFRITLSKTACFILIMVQTKLILSCQVNMQNRIARQKNITIHFSNLSSYLKSFFHSSYFNQVYSANFSLDEINKVQREGLELFSKEEKTSLLERMANLLRKKVEKEYDTPEMAHKHSRLFKNVGINQHKKFITDHMKATQMGYIKESIKELCGSPIFGQTLFSCIKTDSWEKYSIYSNELTPSAFRSTNTVKFNIPLEENERITKTEKCADLSFTPFGMLSVLERSEKLKKEHLKQL